MHDDDYTYSDEQSETIARPLQAIIEMAQLAQQVLATTKNRFDLIDLSNLIASKLDLIQDLDMCLMDHYPHIRKVSRIEEIRERVGEYNGCDDRSCI